MSKAEQDSEQWAHWTEPNIQYFISDFLGDPAVCSQVWSFDL